MGPSSIASRRTPRCSSLPPTLAHCACTPRSSLRAFDCRSSRPSSDWSERKISAMQRVMVLYASARPPAPPAPAASCSAYRAADASQSSNGFGSAAASTHSARTRSTSKSRSPCWHGAFSWPPPFAGSVVPWQASSTLAQRGRAASPARRVSSRQSRFSAFSCTWGSLRMSASASDQRRSSKICTASSISRFSQCKRARCHQQWV
mmetsp:Transcript_6747/g.21026  ORF Transcript_6747/g.21026 Transcript_6747/m.21026 type:complete len:205 (+) Transcript_6747:143-757(+)